VGLPRAELRPPLADRSSGIDSASCIPHAGLAIVGAGSLEAELSARIRIEAVCRNTSCCGGDVPHAGTLRAIEECGVFLRTTSLRRRLHLRARSASPGRGSNRQRERHAAGGVRLIPAANPKALREGHHRDAGRTRVRPQAGASDRMKTNLQAVLDNIRVSGGTAGVEVRPQTIWDHAPRLSGKNL